VKFGIKSTDVSEKYIAYIWMIEEQTYFLMVSCPTYSYDMKMEAISPCETSVDYRTTRRYNTDNRTHL
jgi:hypothetical protein